MQGGLRDSGFSKSLSTGFHKGQVFHEAGLKEQNLAMSGHSGLNSVSMKQDSALMNKQALEATLRGKITKLEVSKPTH